MSEIRTETDAPRRAGGGHTIGGTHRGFALPAAIFSLVVVGVLVTGGFFLAQQEARIGVASENAGRAVYLAEQGMNEVLLGWGTGNFAALTPWQSSTVTGTADGGTWTTQVLKTSPQSYFVRTTGTITEGGAVLSGATHEVGMLFRVILPDIVPPAALVTVGSLTVTGNSEIHGSDTPPVGWGGVCGSTQDKPGIIIDNDANVSQGGSSVIDGSPPIAEDPTLTTEDLLDFGDMSWDELVAMATKVYPTYQTVNNTAPDSVDVGGTYRCRTSTQENWGDPESPGSVCFNYFPIIYAAGGLKLNSSTSGQGILLVEGDLEIQGGFEFYGIVIVSGRLRTSGTGGHINGGVIAANAELDTNVASGNAVVTNSTCAAQRAILNNEAFSRPKPLSRRSWVDMTALSY